MATPRNKAAGSEEDSGAVKAEESSAPTVVSPADGPEHGYVGEVHPDKNNDDYTVAGVTGSTANASDKPPSSAAERVRSKWAPLSS